MMLLVQAINECRRYGRFDPNPAGWFIRELVDIILGEPMYPYYMLRERKNFTFTSFSDLARQSFTREFCIPACTTWFLAEHYDMIFQTMIDDCKKTFKVSKKKYKNALINFFRDQKKTLVHSGLKTFLCDDVIGLVEKYLTMDTHVQLESNRQWTRTELNPSYFTFYSPISPSNIEIIVPPTLSRLPLPDDTWRLLVNVREFRRLMFDSFRTKFSSVMGGHLNNGIMGTLRDSKNAIHYPVLYTLLQTQYSAQPPRKRCKRVVDVQLTRKRCKTNQD